VEGLDLARLTPEATPAALAEWQRAHDPGAELVVHGRWYGPVGFDLVATGAGTSVVDVTEGLGLGQWALRRDPTLADLVAPMLDVLVVGLNPSVVAAERGVPFVGGSNRFWPAALDAGLVPADRDPWRAFTEAHVGFTDLVKRATPRADGLTAAEYSSGAARVRAVVEWLAPRVVCFAGLTGYRRAIDADAAEGEQPARFGGAATYVMPNPSGANAHASRDALVAHLGAVRALATGE
jgi:TDG/mug DNA glycosylase family protein